MRAVKRNGGSGSGSTSGSRSGSGRGSVRRVTNIGGMISGKLGVVCGVIGVVVFSCVYLVAIRQHNVVEMSFDQLSGFERRVQQVGNYSIYGMEAGRKDEVLGGLSKVDWGKVSHRIDFVGFVYGKVGEVMGDGGWMEIVKAMVDMGMENGYGIGLFECGCVVPNLVFKESNVRFDGAECMMLPGFVMRKERVKFVTVDMEGRTCEKRRDFILGGAWYNEHNWKLKDARVEHEQLLLKLGVGNG